MLLEFNAPAGDNLFDKAKVVGKSTPRIDGPRKTTGTAPYAYERHDVAPNQAYGYIVGAGIGKGRIISMDASRARAAPGVLAVITAPELAEVMTPAPGAQILAEVGLTAPLPGLGMIHGAVDRLIVSEAEILAVDYKSNTVVPDRPEDTPEGILRQMAAYRAAMRLIWPGRPVRIAVLWTAARSLMPIPDAVLDHVMAALDRRAMAS